MTSTALTLCAAGPKLLRRRLQVLRLSAGDGHVCAGPGQRRCYPETDTGSPSGNQRHPSGEQVRPEYAGARTHAPSFRAASRARRMPPGAARKSGPLQRLELGRSLGGEGLLQGPDLRRAAESLDRTDAGIRRGQQLGDDPENTVVQGRVLDHLLHQPDGERGRRIERLVGHQHAKRATYPDQTGEGEGGPAVRYQSHPGKGRGKAGAGTGQPHVAGEREIEAEAGRRALHDGEHRDGAAHDRDHGRLEVTQPVLQVGNAGCPARVS